MNITRTIEEMAHGIGYNLRALRNNTVQQSAYLKGYHRGNIRTLRRYLRELLALAPGLRGAARVAFNASRRMEY